MARRITYRNWIAENGILPAEDRRATGRDHEQPFVGLDPRTIDVTDGDLPAEAAARGRTAYIAEQVSNAIAQLSDDEREFVERFYFSGETLREMSKRSGKATYRLAALQRRALRRLKKLLKGFVEETFGVRGADKTRCPICESKRREEIDQMIQSRDRRRSWRPVMRELSKRYGITVASPMTLIGHEKYH